MHSSHAAVELRDVSFKYEYGGEWALRGVDLTVREGEFILVTGPTGAGKSTLGLTICGLVPNFIDGTFNGEVQIIGRTMNRSTFRDLALSVGIVWQNPENQLFGLTVEEEIAFGLENMGLPERDIEERLEWALSAVGMSAFLEKSPYELSGGQKQRVAIAAVLARHPAILVLDEPTAELDPQGRDDVVKVVEHLRKSEKITIIMIEHRLEELMEYVDTAYLMEEGRVSVQAHPTIFFAEPDQLMERGVRPPQVTEFFARARRCDERLVGKKAPLTLSEGIEIFEPLIAESKKKEENPLEHISGSMESEAIHGKPAISAQDVFFSYPDGTEALTSIDLTIHSGDFVGIVGQNGSGKTTLVKHFNGLLKPTKGTVKVFDDETTMLSVAELSKRIGYVSQNPDYQVFSKSVLEEVAFGPRNLKLPEEEANRRVEEALKAMRILHLRDKNPLFLSRADKQKVVVASALAMEPQVLVLDEPTNALDFIEATNLLSLIEDLNRAGRTVVLVTHDMLLAAEHAREIVVMSQKRIIAHDTPRKIFVRAQILRQASLRPPQITQMAMSLSHLGFPSSILSVEEMTQAYRKFIRR